MVPPKFTEKVRPVVLANKDFAKIFVVGANKTGTTTLYDVLKAYGYSVADQRQQEIVTTKQFLSGNYGPLKEFVSQFDAFQDIPFSIGHSYIVSDVLFPNSKFILTERDPESWFESLCAFHKKVFGVSNLENVTEEEVRSRFNYLYKGYIHTVHKWMLSDLSGDAPTVRWDMMYDKSYCIDNYLRRNADIKKYFMERNGSLLVIDVSREETTEKICRFLGIPKKHAFEMPHSNKTRELAG